MYRQAAKMVMYHGTATGKGDDMLRRILKEGLNPGAPKVFSGSENEGNYSYWQDKEIESLGGIYLASQVRKSETYATGAARKFGGDPLIFVVQLETRTPSVSLDEDQLFGKVFAEEDLALARWLRKTHNLVLVDVSIVEYLQQDIWEDVARVFLETNREWHYLNIPPKREETVLPLLAKLLKVQTRYFLAKRYDNIDKGRPGLGWSAKLKYQEYGVEEPHALLNQYRSLMDTFLMKLREAATPTEQKLRDWSGATLRTKENIGYSGVNRILAIMRWKSIDRQHTWVPAGEGEEYGHSEYDLPYSVEGQVVYKSAGADPYIREVIDTLKSSLSDEMLWKDKDGKILFDNPAPIYQQKAAFIRVNGHLYRRAGITLYHATSYTAAENILRHNYFRPSLGTLAVMGLSTTTDPNYWWGRREVRFVLNGQRLAENYTLQTVNEMLPTQHGILNESEIKVLSDSAIQEADYYIERVEAYSPVPETLKRELARRGILLRILGRRANYSDIGFTESGRWGNAGSGFLFTTGERILLLERSGKVEEPYTWGLPGGAIPQRGGELLDAEKSAQKEAREELGSLSPYHVIDQYVYREPGFQYTTFVALVDEEFEPRLNWENIDFAWVAEAELENFDLHFGTVAVLQHTRPFR